MTRDGEAGRGQIRKGLEHFGREVRLHLKGQRNQNDIIQRAFQVGEGDRRGRSSQTKGLVSYQDTPVGGKTEALNKGWGSGEKRVFNSTSMRCTEPWSGEKYHQD